ncbi:MAG: DUF2177 family protein [Pseudomonadota bacterium]|nr:DUF2177 family protein [Pseudomonadota bacterium]
MITLTHVVAYVATAIVFLAVDFVWLTRIARDFYFARLGEMLLTQPRLGVAAAFYLVYVVGIVVFAVMPALRADSARPAIVLGALFGCIAYATYDITNYATLKNWPFAVVVVDIAWGAFLTGLAAFAGYQVTRLLAPMA